MKKALCFVSMLAILGCGGVPGMGGGGGGAWKPDKTTTPFAYDLTDAEVGRSVTYVTEASGSKTKMTIAVVGKDGDNWLVEVWMDTGSMAYGILNSVGSDKVVSKAWAAAKDDESWTEITVEEAPKGNAEGPEPDIKESDESKNVAAGDFSCHRLDVTVNVQGKDYKSTSWYSKDAWMLGQAHKDHGGLVAMESAGMTMSLDSKSDDAKPTIELPE